MFPFAATVKSIIAWSNLFLHGRTRTNSFLHGHILSALEIFKLIIMMITCTTVCLVALYTLSTHAFNYPGKPGYS